jgi:hypothetical protein
MEDSPPASQRASYILHVISVAQHSRGGMTTSPAAQLRLVHLLDEILDLFDTEPRFHHFTLDGQSILLDDYLAIRPENFERVEQAVQEGKLLVGPWYVQLEPAFASVEMLIRNLMIGLRTARVFGSPMLIAYLTEAFTLPSQLPQILRSFGIELAFTLNQPAGVRQLESQWEGDDGSVITLVHTGHAAGMMVIPTQRHILAPHSASGHLPIRQVWDMRSAFEQRIHSLAALAEVQIQLGDEVFHSNLNSHARALDFYAKSNPLPMVQGTLRGSNQPRYKLELVQKLADTENLLTRWVEPFAACADDLSPEADERHIRRPQRLIQNLWRMLLTCHQFITSHSATNTDIVSEIGEYIGQIHQMAVPVLQACLADIADNINTRAVPGEQGIVVFNTTGETYSGAVEVTIQDAHMRIPVIFDASGSVVDVTFLNVAIPSLFQLESTVSFVAEVPPLGYATYAVAFETPTEDMVEEANEKAESPGVLDIPKVARAVVTGIHGGMLPLAASLIIVSDPTFRITTIKLPEEAERSGVVVRGLNYGDNDLWVTVVPWRPFTNVEIVTLDEVPTGGQLAPESNGAVQFRAAPRRILTLWFHD